MWLIKLEKIFQPGINLGRLNFVKIGDMEQLQGRFIIAGNAWEQRN
jgi:hypothetical protein